MGTSFAGTLFLQSGVPGPQRERFSIGTHVSRPESVERKVPGRNELVNLNLVKITASLDIQGPAAKLKRARRFLQGPRTFCCSRYLKKTL